LSFSNKTLKYYQNNAPNLTNRYETADVSKMQNELLSIVAKCSSVLELGCGSGRDASFLKGNLPSLQLTATDGSNKMLDSASALHPRLTRHLKQIKIPSQLLNITKKFDCVYSIATLMHLNESEITETLSNITELLNNKGILFISVCTHRNQQQEKDKRTFTLRTAKWWEGQLINNGFIVSRINQNSDGLKRDKTIWLNITAVKKHIKE